MNTIKAMQIYGTAHCRGGGGEWERESSTIFLPFITYSSSYT